MTTGEKIKAIRSERQLTQKQLAKLTGLSEITIRKYEAEERTSKKEQLQKLAEALEVCINTLLDDDMLKAEYHTVADVMSLIITLDNVVSLKFSGERDNEGRLIPETMSFSTENKNLNDVLSNWEYIREKALKEKQSSCKAVSETLKKDPHTLDVNDLLNILNFDPLQKYKESVDLSIETKLNTPLNEKEDK